MEKGRANNGGRTEKRQELNVEEEGGQCSVWETVGINDQQQADLGLEQLGREIYSPSEKRFDEVREV